jgi:hypothetical protein
MNLRKEKQLIKFKHLADMRGLEPIVPSSKVLPEWYKNTPSPLTHNSPVGELVTRKQGLKACMPFLDAMIQGYIIPLWCDLYVSVTYNNEGEGPPIPIVQFTWPRNFWSGLDETLPTEVVSHHPKEQTEGVPIMEESLGGAPAFKLLSPWIIETPKNYSSLFVPILNNQPKNMSFFSAIVATDTYHDRINFPFVWTGEEEWEGIIPSGTPFIQVIPFKRDDFQHEIVDLSKDDKDKMYTTKHKIRHVFINAYKDFFRRKVNST